MSEVVVVSGSRRFKDQFRASLLIDETVGKLAPESTVIHGAAMGTDQIAAEAAERRGLTVKEFPADWKTLGRRAGIVRNLEMLDENPDRVIAFWDGKSRGTAHMIRATKERGIPLQIYVEGTGW